MVGLQCSMGIGRLAVRLGRGLVLGACMGRCSLHSGPGGCGLWAAVTGQWCCNHGRIKLTRGRLVSRARPCPLGPCSSSNNSNGDSSSNSMQGWGGTTNSKIDVSRCKFGAEPMPAAKPMGTQQRSPCNGMVQLPRHLGLRACVLVQNQDRMTTPPCF